MTWQEQAKQSEYELQQFIEAKYKEAFLQVSNIKLATLWYRWIRGEKGNWLWEFNHLEDGHCQGNNPTPKVPLHNQIWKGGKWGKSHIQLNGTGNVVGHYIIY